MGRSRADQAALDACERANVEVFHRDAAECREANAHRDPETPPYRVGWYYWTCLPGCLPDSDAFGPYRSAVQAAHAAVEQFDLPWEFCW